MAAHRSRPTRAWVLSRPSRVQLFETLWTVARQAPPSMGFSRQDIGVGCHALLQGIFRNQEDQEPTSLVSPALAGSFFTTSTTREALRESNALPNWPQAGETPT